MSFSSAQVRGLYWNGVLLFSMNSRMPCRMRLRWYKGGMSASRRMKDFFMGGEGCLSGHRQCCRNRKTVNSEMRVKEKKCLI